MQDWAQLFLKPEWLSRPDRLAERRFGPGGLAEEAAAYVIQALSEDDWARCRQYKGNAKPETYLHTLANNAPEAFSRRRFGRVRAPKWLKREGPTWIELWKRLCMERQSTQQVLEAMRNSGRDRERIRHMATTIKARLPWCGSSAQEIPVQYDDDGRTRSAPEDLSAEHGAESEAARSRYEVLALSLSYLIGRAAGCVRPRGSGAARQRGGGSSGPAVGSGRRSCEP